MQETTLDNYYIDTRITRGARPALPCDLLSFRTLLTNLKAFQTQSNSRNFDATGSYLTQDFGTFPSKNRDGTPFFLMTNFITNLEKNLGAIGLLNLSRLGFPRCDFRCHQPTYLPTNLLTYQLTCWFFRGGDALWKPAKAGIKQSVSDAYRTDFWTNVFLPVRPMYLLFN